MNRKQIIMDLRANGKLKGVKPCMVFLKNNLGQIYTEGQADFVMSIKGDTLYFQKITLFLKRLKPKDDFSVNLNNFKEYAFFQKALSNTLCLYDDKKRFLEINYNKGIPDTYMTEDNISRIIKIIEEKGIKEIYNEEENIDEKLDTKGEGTN